MGEMKPGNVRTFKKGEGNAVVLAVGVWADKEKSGWLRIDITGIQKSHTTVTNNPESERYHRTLFRDLRRVLVSQSCWPFGSEGAETESKSQPRWEGQACGDGHGVSFGARSQLSACGQL